jgi:alpha-ketoglutarate-dependent 2,4-dichlorophenoxyacetate dioxygenase
MPHAEPFKRIQVKELHPTFGAQILGVDFSKPVSDDVFAEVLAAITKVEQKPSITLTLPTSK